MHRENLEERVQNCFVGTYMRTAYYGNAASRIVSVFNSFIESALKDVPSDLFDHSTEGVESLFELGNKLRSKTIDLSTNDSSTSSKKDVKECIKDQANALNWFNTQQKVEKVEKSKDENMLWEKLKEELKKEILQLVDEKVKVEVSKLDEKIEKIEKHVKIEKVEKVEENLDSKVETVENKENEILEMKDGNVPKIPIDPILLEKAKQTNTVEINSKIELDTENDDTTNENVGTSNKSNAMLPCGTPTIENPFLHVVKSAKYVNGELVVEK
ncbi:hypothetical protein EIN_200630 [Entamoeba invadens IP1]|uniref:Uncharacterized protein n=1 Tax=Entamoeba invadens IP1 TaxID=370355 RepID=L7FJ41_ENTIV|nr:hypothetical protein EIN_200630 [Entamoeba invadens IP1]ELP83635.1 hypothetical protein EIN_200630 [Entamoeba invadens IP1]|eukprot:XP_004182981.1 hypothetical protein EIN_200630 [Entamoeba invadens IP1]